MKKSFLFFFLNILLLLFVRAQNIEIRALNHDGSNILQNLFQVAIINTNTSSYSVYMEATISSNQGGKIYEVQSAVFSLNVGWLNVQQSFISPIRVLMSNLKNDNTLAEGKYLINIRVYEEESHRFLGEVIWNKEVLASEVITEITSNQSVQLKKDGNNRPPSKWGELNQTLNLNGNARLYAQYTHREGNSLTLPPQNFVRFEMNPSMKIKGVPITANVLLTNQQNSMNQPMNRFNISFDSKQLMQVLKAELIKKIQQATDSQTRSVLAKWDSLQNVWRVNPIQKKIDSLSALLNNPNIKSQLTQYEEYKQMVSAINSPNFTSELKTLSEKEQTLKVSSLEELMEKQAEIPLTEFEEMKRLYELKLQYEEIKMKADSLEINPKSIQKYLKWQEQMNELSSQLNQGIPQSPEQVFQAAKILGISTRSIEKIKDWKEISLGSCYPYLSPLTLNGMMMRGIHLNWNPKQKFYLSISAGMIQRATRDTFAVNKANYFRALTAIKMGYGSSEKSHLYVLYMKAWDIGKTIIPADSIAIHPQMNDIVGVDGQLNLFKERILVKGEMNYALHTLDKNAPQNPGASKLPFFFRPIANTSSQLDMAANLQFKLRLWKDKNRISGFYTWLGPGYYSMGVPYLLTDRERYEIKYEHSLLKNKINIQSFYRKDHDNLISWKSNQTILQSAGVNLHINLPKYPIISLQYAPYLQRNDGAGIAFNQVRNSLLSVSFSHNYGKQKVNFQTHLTYSRQWIQNSEIRNNGGSNFVNILSQPADFLCFTQGVSFSKCSFQLAANYISSYGANKEVIKIYGMEGTSRFAIKNKLTLLVSGQMAQTPLTNQRISASLQLSYKITPFMQLGVQSRYLNFQGKPSESYQDVWNMVIFETALGR